MYAGISIPNSPAVRSSWRRKKSVIHSRNTFFSRFSDRSPIFLFITSSVLHVRRNLNPQQSRRPLQLAAEEIRHPQQKHFLLAVFFVAIGVLLVEVAERLRQLECID